MKKRRVLRFDKPSTPAPQPLLNPEEAQDTDYEICWCIERLENILLKNINEREKKKCEMSIKLLRKPETALITKKQIMRQHFGDYKKSLASDKKNLKNNVNIQFKNVDAPVKSVCIRSKKAIGANEECFKSLNNTDSKLKINYDNGKKIYGISLSDNSFRFNF